MRIIIGILAVILLAGCKEKYTPKLNNATTAYLVVEGFINSSGGASTFVLTRTTRLTDPGKIVYERGAMVKITSELGKVYPLTETSPGTYTSAALTLDKNDRYRLSIQAGGKEYLSDYSKMRNTPAIDSVSWQLENNGLQLYVNTHDPKDSTRYYQWKHEQTWEFHSSYTTSLKYSYDNQNNITGVTYRLPSRSADMSVYRCWQSEKLQSISIGSSEKLSKDVIHAPLIQIPKNSWKVSVLYSVLVKQYALSREAYKFFEEMKRNTEQLGSIFDAQPSANTGNLRCVTKPDEVVIGFVEVSEEKEKRLFISAAQLPADWAYVQPCEAIQVKPNNIDTIRSMAGYLPTDPVDYAPSGAIVTLGFGTPSCIDCTLRGTNVKPSFWP
ncbi:DUF4249 domain-containing protein [Sediminibacterium ginsengisoli]|uniref:DUF4249 domain-containing protein n=1 Tax=Sediminibacterium ginsengisoli TaxID=413434 RepID=A0A1T4RC21_9BACT|nr:DUF4249 domain-containing protein [Sediminibacterium ginsengisoli]SKA13544.1 protein of unknown function [Sediminibacterium ginsengisoli]